MDIFAHGFWSAGLAKYFNKYKIINIKLAAFWGVFPDLFAFTISFVIIIYNLIFNKFIKPNLEAFEPVKDIPLSSLTHVLYNISHSLIIFSLMFIITLIIFKKPIYEMFGWLLHILIDIPTHSYKFFPTPFLWPVSDFKINGFTWADPYFMIFNYVLLILFYIYLFRKKK